MADTMVKEKEGKELLAEVIAKKNADLAKRKAAEKK